MNERHTLLHQVLDDCDDSCAYLGIINPSRPIAKGWLKINNGVKLDEVVASFFWIEVYSPEVFRLRAIVQKECFFVGVQFTVECHNPSVYINDSLDELTKNFFSQLLEFLAGKRLSGADYNHIVSLRSEVEGVKKPVRVLNTRSGQPYPLYW